MKPKVILRKWWFWLTGGVVVSLIVAGTLGGGKSPQGTRPAAKEPLAPGTTASIRAPSSGATHTPPGPSTIASAPSSSDGAGAARFVLRFGPGPQITYTVQAQPPPGSCHYTYGGSDPLPDPRCTPGALNPQVTQTNIGSTVCRSGYTSAIRPPESVTEPEKQGSAGSYGYTGTFSTAEYDHLVPLELGGDPNDPSNLWVEPNDNPNATVTQNSKDALENRLNSLVCSGRLALVDAQDAIASNWVAAYRTYMGGEPSYSSPPSTTQVPAGGPSCQASAAPANDGYGGDYYVSVTSNQPDQKATASDSGDTWSSRTDSSGNVRILLYHTTPGERINVTVGAASCSTTA